MRRQGPGYEEEKRPEAALSAFDGYAPPTSSTTYTPNQFFDVVLPHASRGCLRLVAYLIQKTLRYSDADGNPMYPETHVTYRELVEKAGIGRGRIKEAIEEAIERKCIECLRFGQPHRPGEEGFSALYSLRWDERPDYVTALDSFDGFFAGEGNYTRIPNDFFDHTIPSESLAIVKVVGVIIRHTIGWQQKVGFRRQQIRMSFTEMMRRSGIASRSTLNLAIKEAILRNHIERVEEGLFDPYNAVATIWGVKWSDSPRLPVVEPRFANGSEIEPGKAFLNRTRSSETVPKSHQEDGSQIEPGERSRNRTSDLDSVPESNQQKRSQIEPAKGSRIEPESVPDSNREAFQNRTSIKTNLKRSPKQQQTANVVVEGDSLALLKRELEAVGVTPDKAQQLVNDEPSEVIRRQLDWLPRRVVKKTAAGLLIACIEMDLPEPSGGVQTSEHLTSGRAFVIAFYQEMAGNTEEPLAEPTAEDERQATRLLQRLNLSEVEASQKAGASFARFVRSKEAGKKNPARACSYAVRLYGDDFVSDAKTKSLSGARRRTEEAKKEHEQKFAEAYDAFVLSFAERIECDEALVEAFEEDTDRKVRSRRRLSENAADMLLSDVQDSEKRSRLLVEFAKERGAISIPTFWEWDRKRNDESFEGNA